MASRSRLIQAACVVLGVAGSCFVLKTLFFIDTLSTPVDLATGSGKRVMPLLRATTTVSLPTTSSPDARVSHSIYEFLDLQRDLGPEFRDVEDEIRCELSLLLNDGNAAAIVQALPEGDLHSEFGVAALSRWASADVRSASIWLASRAKRSDEQTWAVAQVLIKAPTLLNTLVDALAVDPWRETLLEYASRAALADNPEQAAFLASRMQAGTRRTHTMIAIADGWTLSDPISAEQWIARETDPTVRDELVISGAAAVASADATEAMGRTLAITSDSRFEYAIHKIASIGGATRRPKRAISPRSSRLTSSKVPLVPPRRPKATI